MVVHVSKSLLEAKALEYFRQVERTGEVLVITDRGRPVLQISPYQDSSTQSLGELRECAVRYDQATDPVGLQDWEMLADTAEEPNDR